MDVDKFYSVQSLSIDMTKIVADISIDPSHPIFEGHFPNQPILPGVCMMQIVRELMSTALGFSLVLTEAANVKFLRIINPLEHNNVNVEIIVSTKEPAYESTSRIYLGDTTFFSMKAVFQKSFL